MVQNSPRLWQGHAKQLHLQLTREKPAHTSVCAPLSRAFHFLPYEILSCLEGVWDG